MVVLVVEDEPAVRDAIDRALRLDGYETAMAGDGPQALAQVARRAPDVVVLDLGLPGLDGLEVCRRLRADGDRTPVLVLTARDAVGDRIAGLDAGADDYLVKPFALGELRARLRALLRRSGWDEEPADRRLRFADVLLDGDTRQVFRGDREVALTRTEYHLLEHLLRHPRTALSRSSLFEAVWGCDLGATSNALDVYVSYLRRKLEAGGEPRVIQTVRGFGYALREP